jgi:hypothetical protein
VDRDAIQDAAAQIQERRGDLLIDILQTAAADVTKDQSLESERVRASLFGVSPSGKWEIVASSNDSDEADRGFAFETKSVYEAATEGQTVVTSFGGDEDEVGSPDWTIALPVLAAEQPVWILCVSGSRLSPGPIDLRSIASRLLYYREVLELLLKSNARSQ